MSDVPVTTYDPDDAPRSLRSVSPESREMYERQIEALQREIDLLNREAGMFNSAGWKSVRGELEDQLGIANQALRDDRINTMEGIAFVRGQMRAFEYLLGLERITTLRRQAAQEQLQSLRSAEGPH